MKASIVFLPMVAAVLHGLAVPSVAAGFSRRELEAAWNAPRNLVAQGETRRTGPDRLGKLLESLKNDAQVPSKLRDLILQSPKNSFDEKLVLMSKACELVSNKNLADSATNRLLAALLDALFGDLVYAGRGAFASSFLIKGLGVVGFRRLEDEAQDSAVVELDNKGEVHFRLAAANLIVSVMKRGDQYFAAYAAGPDSAVVEREITRVDFDPTGVANRAAFVAGVGNDAARVLELQVQGERDKRIRAAIVTMAMQARIISPDWYLAWAENRGGREVGFFPAWWLSGWMPRDSADLHVFLSPDETRILGAYDYKFIAATRNPDDVPNREVPNVDGKTESREKFELAGKDGRRYAIGIDGKGRFAYKGYTTGTQFVMLAAINHAVGMRWRLLSAESGAFDWVNRNDVHGISGLAHLAVGLPNDLKCDLPTMALMDMGNGRLSTDTVKADTIPQLRIRARLVLRPNFGIASLDVTTENGQKAANAIGHFYSRLPHINVILVDTAGKFHGATILYGYYQGAVWYARTTDLSKPGSYLVGMGDKAGQAILFRDP